MKFLPLLKTCIRALVRNPMRAALTILGIIIGIASIISIVSTIKARDLRSRLKIPSLPWGRTR